MQADPGENGHVEIGELPHSPGACPSLPATQGSLVPWAALSPGNASSNRTRPPGNSRVTGRVDMARLGCPLEWTAAFRLTPGPGRG